MPRFIRAATAGVLLAASLLVAACASSGPTPTTFGPQSPTALLVLAGPRVPYLVNTGFRRVDLAAGTFEREYQGFSAGPFGGDQITRDGPVSISLREVVPGDYALVSILMVPGSSQLWSCMPEGGPVFTLRPGTVTIVRTDPYWFAIPGGAAPARVEDATVLSVVEALRGGYPGIVGEATVATPAATIQWREQGMGMTRNCSESPTFVRLG